MTKQQLQQELKEVVKEGVKPSDIRKLKKSKSTGDIPKAPPLPTATPLARSQSNQPFTDTKYPYTTLVSQQQTLEKLEKETQAKSDTIKLLRKKIEDLEKSNPPSQLLQDQLTNKQKQIESLRQQLEEKNTPTELDNSLLARHKSLKDWFTQYQKTKQLDTELQENIDEAAQELISQDQTISQLRGQVKHLELTNQSLTKDLNLVTRLAESRKDPLPNNNSHFNLLIYAVLALWFITLLNSSWKPQSQYER